MFWFFAELHAFLIGAKITAFLYSVFTMIFWILAIIGLITVIRFFVRRRRAKKMTPGERWLHTGRID